jgi:hypothetical protein
MIDGSLVEVGVYIENYGSADFSELVINFPDYSTIVISKILSELLERGFVYKYNDDGNVCYDTTDKFKKLMKPFISTSKDR